jgi:hypothetical protein
MVWRKSIIPASALSGRQPARAGWMIRSLHLCILGACGLPLLNLRWEESHDYNANNHPTDDSR